MNREGPKAQAEVTMPEPVNIRLAGAVLPETAEKRRRHVRRPSRRTPHYLERYDRRTLFYDVVYQADRGGYLFTAPRFLNLWTEFRDRLRLDAAPVTGLRRQTSGKYEQVFVKAEEGVLSLDWPGGGWSLAPRRDVSALFDGLNTVVTMNRNNDPDWIIAWLRYHVAAHALQAALIFDNGSSDYTAQDLARAAAGVAGLETVCIAEADYPYGPRDSGKGLEIRPKFLQPALLNLARTDILRHARAVLNVDIDELVLRRSGPSVFDRAVRRPLAAVRLPGRWAYPGPEDPVPTGHRAHVWRAPDPKPSNPKWCAVPGRGLSRMGWFVHHVGGEAFRFLKSDPDCEFVHCRGTSTGWKGGRYSSPRTPWKDPELEALMTTCFHAQDGHDA